MSTEMPAIELVITRQPPGSIWRYHWKLVERGTDQVVQFPWGNYVRTADGKCDTKRGARSAGRKELRRMRSAADYQPSESRQLVNKANDGPRAIAKALVKGELDADLRQARELELAQQAFQRHAHDEDTFEQIVTEILSGKTYAKACAQLGVSANADGSLSLA